MVVVVDPVVVVVVDPVVVEVVEVGVVVLVVVGCVVVLVVVGCVVVEVVAPVVVDVVEWIVVEVVAAVVVDVVAPVVVDVVAPVVVEVVDAATVELVVTPVGVTTQWIWAGLSFASVVNVSCTFQYLSSCVVDAGPSVQAMPRLYVPGGMSPGLYTAKLNVGMLMIGPGPPAVVAFAVCALT